MGLGLTQAIRGASGGGQAPATAQSLWAALQAAAGRGALPGQGVPAAGLGAAVGTAGAPGAAVVPGGPVASGLPGQVGMAGGAGPGAGAAPEMVHPLWQSLMGHGVGSQQGKQMPGQWQGHPLWQAMQSAAGGI